nr:septum formation initiator family protein [Thermus neutrinimicus]
MPPPSGATGHPGYNGPIVDRPIYRILHLVFALGLAHALFLLGQEGVRAYELARERARLEEALRQAEARVARLEAEVRAAKDPAHLEALVRRLGFVRQEEILKRR